MRHSRDAMTGSTISAAAAWKMTYQGRSANALLMRYELAKHPDMGGLRFLDKNFASTGIMIFQIGKSCQQ